MSRVVSIEGLRDGDDADRGREAWVGKPSLDGVVTSEETAGTDAGAPVPRRRRTTRTVVAAALAVVLVLAAGGTAWGVTVHNRHVTAQKIADATQSNQAAVSTLPSDGDAYSSALKTATTAAMVKYGGSALGLGAMGRSRVVMGLSHSKRMRCGSSYTARSLRV